MNNYFIENENIHFVEKFYPSGKIKSVYLVVLKKFVSQLQNNLVVEQFFNENGQLKRTTNYKLVLKKLIKEGLEIIYFQNNSKVRSYINYKNGKIEGKVQIFSINGNLEYTSEYKEGIKHGKTCFYNSNGEIEKIKNYKNGKEIKLNFNL